MPLYKKMPLKKSITSIGHRLGGVLRDGDGMRVSDVLSVCVFVCMCIVHMYRCMCQVSGLNV